MIQTARALQWAWLTLVLVTVLSFTVAESAGISGDLVTIVIIAAAALKGRVILVWFMGLRSFPLPWRVFFGVWLLVNAGVIVGFHFLGQV
jgi:hypothetical protein